MNMDEIYKSINELQGMVSVNLGVLSSIKSLNFAVIELGLYLNTHPDDERALCLHKEYCRQLKDIKDKYQKMYGPLSIYYPCNKWRWLEEPWPWEGGNI